MNISEIIHINRKLQNLTQEQLASYLGVSTPAVNKWEKGNSYPDITLLPALARALSIDVNTLLSFQEDLTEMEVNTFLAELKEIVQKDGFHASYLAAMQKIQAYPNCHLLILQTALALTGFFVLYPFDNFDDYKEELEQLFLRASESSNPDISTPADTMLASNYMNRSEFEKAQAILDRMPETRKSYKHQIQVNICFQQGNYEKAAKLAEHEILSSANELLLSLNTLLDISIKESRMEDAAYFADVSRTTARLFELWDYNAYTAHFQLYLSQKNPEKLIETLNEMLPAALSPWKMSETLLYRHIGNGKDQNTIQTAALEKNLISAIEKNEGGELDFLIEHPDYEKQIAAWKQIQR